MAVWPVQLSAPFAANDWYLAHHVGLSGLLLCARTGAAARINAPASRARAGTVVMKPPQEKPGANYTRERDLANARPASPTASSPTARTAFTVSSANAPA